MCIDLQVHLCIRFDTKVSLLIWLVCTLAKLALR